MDEKRSACRLLLIQSDQAAARRNAECFTQCGAEIAGIVTNGADAARAAADTRPDAVLMDAFMPGRSCVDITETLRAAAQNEQMVLAVQSQVQNDRLAQEVMEAGADLFLLLPLDYTFLWERFRAVAEKKRAARPASSAGRDAERYVAELMHQIGMPAHVRGYEYVRDAILLALQDRRLLKALTKELYPAVAKLHRATVPQVERAMRHAIDLAWSRGSFEVQNALFGSTVSVEKGKPTNGEFISLMAERIRLDHYAA